jgi:hypothetical protein
MLGSPRFRKRPVWANDPSFDRRFAASPGKSRAQKTPDKNLRRHVRHIDHFAGRYDVVFATHHWPTWGAEPVVDYLKKLSKAAPKVCWSSRQCWTISSSGLTL